MSANDDAAQRAGEAKHARALLGLSDEEVKCVEECGFYFLQDIAEYREGRLAAKRSAESGQSAGQSTGLLMAVTDLASQLSLDAKARRENLEGALLDALRILEEASASTSKVERASKVERVKRILDDVVSGLKLK